MGTSVSQKLGIIAAGIGAILLMGVGWLYSWWMVPEIGRAGMQNLQISGLVTQVWGLSAPVGGLIALIGAGIYAKLGWRRIIVMAAAIFITILLIGLFSPSTLLPGLFGINGGLIGLFFLGILLHWCKTRKTRSPSGQTASDLRMAGYVFFLVASWYMCGLLGAPSFALRPELMEKYGTIGDAISLGSTVSISLVIGWVLLFVANHVEARA